MQLTLSCSMTSPLYTCLPTEKPINNTIFPPRSFIMIFSLTCMLSASEASPPNDGHNLSFGRLLLLYFTTLHTPPPHHYVSNSEEEVWFTEVMHSCRLLAVLSGRKVIYGMIKEMQVACNPTTVGIFTGHYYEVMETDGNRAVSFFPINSLSLTFQHPSPHIKKLGTVNSTRWLSAITQTIETIFDFSTKAIATKNVGTFFRLQKLKIWLNRVLQNLESSRHLYKSLEIANRIDWLSYGRDPVEVTVPTFFRSLGVRFLFFSVKLILSNYVVQRFTPVIKSWTVFYYFFRV